MVFILILEMHKIGRRSEFMSEIILWKSINNQSILTTTEAALSATKIKLYPSTQAHVNSKLLWKVKNKEIKQEVTTNIFPITLFFFI